MGETELDLERASISDREEAEEKVLEAIPSNGPPAIQDWDGPNDPGNAQNWSMSKRVYHSVAIALLCLASTFGASVYTPGIAGVSKDFHVSPTVATLGLSMYTFAQGFGPIFAAPVSEIFGRVVVYRVTPAISLAFTLGAGYSQTLAQLLVCRFFAGAFSGPVLAVGAGSNADMWPQQYRAIASSLYLLSPFMGPALGPPAGGFSIMRFSWRWTQFDILWISIPIYLLSLPMQETYKKIILNRRAAKVAKEKAQNSTEKPQVPAGPPRSTQIKVLITVILYRPIKMMLFEPIVLFLCIYNAYAFAVLFSFFGAYPIVFQGVYKFNPGESGLTFFAVGTGVALGTVTGILSDTFLYQKQHKKAVAEGRKVTDPEHRLYAAMLGSVGLPVGIFWFAWTAREDIHWISPVLAGIPFGWGVVTIFLSSVLYTIDVYGPLNGASAIAANGFARYTLAAAFPLFTRQTYNTLGIAWATSLYGFLSLAMLPIPWILFKWGPRIRALSKFTS